VKVSELIAKLHELPPDLEVYCMTQEDSICHSGSGSLRTFVIDDVYSLRARQFYDSGFELVAEIGSVEEKHQIAVVDFSIFIR
jgi:hypothetical protein